MDKALAYEGRLFVTPKEPYQWLLSHLKRWKGAQPSSLTWLARHGGLQTPLAPGDHVLGLTGEHGIGKTWLLRYLAEEERRLASQAVYLDLEERSRFSCSEDYVRAVEARIEQQCLDDRVVLLLDAVPPQMDAHLRALEETILRPCLQHRSALVIMALVRPSQSCWRAPALRGGYLLRLEPFDDAATAEQLQKLRKAGYVQVGVEAQALHASSGGLPLLSYLVASRSLAEAAELLLEYWFSPLPSLECACARNYLEAVCLLDSLEQASMQRALEIYYHYTPGAAGFPAHAGGVRNILQKHWLAHPAGQAPGRLVLVESVQRAAREVLKSRDWEMYQVLSRAAMGSKGSG
jgi:hypothetical protein